MESTSQAVATTASPNSATPTSAAPQMAAPSGMNPSVSYQASPTTAQMGQPAPVQAAPAAPASAGNPWQEAFQALSASLNTSNPSQAQVPSSAYQTPTPQASPQANWASTQQSTQAQYSAAPTYSPQASTQGYSATEVQQLLNQQAAQLQSAAPVSDSYLSQISDESLEVLEHFGAEAPNLLNTYACAVEDALIEQVQRGQSMSLMLEAAGEERSAMNLMLTNPDVLADYVNDFFGPNGPYPTETREETAARQQQEARAQFEQEIIAQETNNVPQSFQRPEMDMPTPGRQVNAANDFWGGFSQMMDQNPEQAWQYLSQAPQGSFQTKALVQDY